MIKVILLAILCAIALISCGDGREEQLPEKISAVYSWHEEDADMIHSASVSLYEDGTFIFGFSPVSSYIGHGEYKIEDDMLYLKTDDGDFHYSFKIAGEDIIYDAENSSGFTWFSEFGDGDVFVGVKTAEKNEGV